MSDELLKVGTAAPRISPGIVEHWCEREGCSNWGSHGYSRGRNQPTVWFCYEHRADGERYLGKA